MTLSCRSMLVLTRISGCGLLLLIGCSMGGEVVCIGDSSSSSRSGVSERPSESLKLFSLGILDKNQRNGASRGRFQRRCWRKALVVGVVRGGGGRNVRITVHGRVQVLPRRRSHQRRPHEATSSASQITYSLLDIPETRHCVSNCP